MHGQVFPGQLGNFAAVAVEADVAVGQVSSVVAAVKKKIREIES